MRSLPCASTWLTGARAGLAVDGDAARQHAAPADERDPQDLALHDPDQRLEQDHDRVGFPRRRVLHEDHVGARGQVLAAFDGVAQSAEHAQREEHRVRQHARHPEASAPRQEQADDAVHEAERNRPHRHEHGEHHGAERTALVSPFSRAGSERSAMRANSARSCREQRQAVAAQRRVLGVDHHRVEERIDGGTQRGEPRERAARSRAWRVRAPRPRRARPPLRAAPFRPARAAARRRPRHRRRPGRGPS